MSVNLAVLNSLPVAQQARGIQARIDTPIGPLSFLYNPESEAYARTAQYAEAITGGTAIADQNYIRSTGRTLELSDLLLDSHCAGRSLRPLIEGIENLLIPTGPGLSPPVLAFTWGSSTFAPCVLTSMSWTVTGWLSGEPALGRLSLSFLQVPDPEAPGADIAAPDVAVSDEPAVLTDRQKAEAREKAGEWLKENASNLKPAVKAAVSANAFRYSTSDEGVVIISDARGDVLGVVGTWDGFEFEPSTEGELTK